ARPRRAWTRRQPPPPGRACARHRGLAAAQTGAGDRPRRAEQPPLGRVVATAEAWPRRGPAPATPPGWRRSNGPEPPLPVLAPWLRFASPTHTGEGAEGRRELRAGGRVERRPLRKGAGGRR